MRGNRIHIFGASGSGTTTLGNALSKKLNIRHIDTDDYFWMKTDPPFQKIVATEERQKNLGQALQRNKDFLSWAMKYDTAGPEMRSKVMHEEWIKSLPVKVIRIEGEIELNHSIKKVLNEIEKPSPRN